MRQLQNIIDWASSMKELITFFADVEKVFDWVDWSCCFLTTCWQR